MKIKELFRRFRAWQLDPFRKTTPCMEHHVCANCGHEFEGQYCPVYGQDASVGRADWSSVKEESGPCWGWQRSLRWGPLSRCSGVPAI